MRGSGSQMTKAGVHDSIQLEFPEWFPSALRVAAEEQFAAAIKEGASPGTQNRLHRLISHPDRKRCGANSTGKGELTETNFIVPQSQSSLSPDFTTRCGDMLRSCESEAIPENRATRILSNGFEIGRCVARRCRSSPRNASKMPLRVYF